MPNLSSMPTELTEMILRLVYRLPSIHQTHQNQQTIRHQLNSNWHPLRRILETSYCISWNEIRSLASVNRLFYQILSPYIFHSLDLKGFTVDKLKFTLEEIISRHSDHVRNIRWKITDYMEFLQEREEPLNADKYYNHPYWLSQWDPKLRSGILLKILESCPNLTDLDIDLDPNSFEPTEDPEKDDLKRVQGPSISSDHQMPNLLIKPISQLILLTHLSISNPYPRPSYTESYIVDILSHLPQLQSFGCAGVDPTHPKPLDDLQPCKSPLGLYLASLPHLVELQLDWVECWDASWNQLDWKSPLEALYVSSCYDIPVSVLHGFFRLFKSTLTTLILSVCIDDPDALNSVFVPDDFFRFELPKLINLEIMSNLAIRFSRAFQNSKSLSWLSLGYYPLDEIPDLEALIQDELWPNLETLEIEDMSPRTHSEVASLEALCQRYEIELVFCVNFDGEDEGQ